MTYQYYELQLHKGDMGWCIAVGEYDSPEQIEEELSKTIAGHDRWRIVEVTVNKIVVRGGRD